MRTIVEYYYFINIIPILTILDRVFQMHLPCMAESPDSLGRQSARLECGMRGDEVRRRNWLKRKRKAKEPPQRVGEESTDGRQSEAEQRGGSRCGSLVPIRLRWLNRAELSRDDRK